MIIMWIAHDARDLGGLGEIDDLEVGGEHLVVGLADERECLLAAGRVRTSVSSSSRTALL